MCCSTGVCGPNPDPVLPRFAADLKWLAGQGLVVERFNLAGEPQAFASNEKVKTALVEYGNECLPLILVDDAVVSRGCYPSREELAGFVDLQDDEISPLYTDAVGELVAIGAAIASNCEPCFKFHFDKARKLGVSLADMARAVETAQAVRENPARSVLELANRFLKRDERAKPAPEGLPVMQSDCSAPGTASGENGGCC